MNKSEVCPNAVGCQVLNKAGLVENMQLREFYRINYCANDASDGFSTCKRFQTKKMLGFCPDFVFPDSVMTMDKIMEKCEE